MRSSSLCFRLARQNIRTHYRTYVPFLLASTGTVMMCFMIALLARQPAFGGSLSAMLESGSWIAALFAFNFILYINNFLMKQRTREFGLYNILGMEKKHIALIMLYETLITYLVCLFSGIVLGFAFSKLMQLILLRLMHFAGDLEIYFSWPAAGFAAVLFAVIFFLAYCRTLWLIQRLNPVQLLKSSDAGEKEPKVKWVRAVLGMVCLGTGYWMAQYVRRPDEAFLLFFAAVALVMVGTYFLFTAGSIAILKLLQKNKKYYYQKNHFINVSGMMYRMKQNARGLANICILSCMVLVTVSMTLSLYQNRENLIQDTFPRNIAVWAQVNSAEEIQTVRQQLDQLSAKAYSDPLAYSQITQYAWLVDSRLILESETDSDAMEQDLLRVNFYDVDSYRTVTGDRTALQKDQLIAYSTSRSALPSVLQIAGQPYQVVKVLNQPVTGLHEVEESGTEVIDLYCSDLFALRQAANIRPPVMFHENFEIAGDSQSQKELTAAINSQFFAKSEITGHATSAAQDSEEYYRSYGSIMFLGIFLGLLFFMATAMIIYYKQISEGYEDRQRYQILQQVGLSRREVRRTINSQVVSIFFLPLAVALIHILFAFNMVAKMLLAMEVYHTAVFIRSLLETVAVFAAIYAAVYWITSRVYYHIVEQHPLQDKQ